MISRSSLGQRRRSVIAFSFVAALAFSFGRFLIVAQTSQPWLFVETIANTIRCGYCADLLRKARGSSLPRNSDLLPAPVSTLTLDTFHVGAATPALVPVSSQTLPVAGSWVDGGAVGDPSGRLWLGISRKPVIRA